MYAGRRRPSADEVVEILEEAGSEQQGGEGGGGEGGGGSNKMLDGFAKFVKGFQAM